MVGEKHPEFGESPVAFLVTDHPLDETALVAHCRAQLAPFKRPRRFVRVERLPGTRWARSRSGGWRTSSEPFL